MTQGERIKEALHFSRHSQAWLAKELNVTPACVTQWVKDQRKKLNAERAIKIAELTGVRPEWLALEMGEMV